MPSCRKVGSAVSTAMHTSWATSSADASERCPADSRERQYRTTTGMDAAEQPLDRHGVPVDRTIDQGVQVVRFGRVL